VENATAIKISNLVVAYWLNILCKRCGVKWRNCYQHNVNATQLLTCTSYTEVYRPGKMASE